ncbi:MAG: LysM peptidoglycan-binding domain-containing protein [Verrucomicrobiota bacterium]
MDESHGTDPFLSSPESGKAGLMTFLPIALALVGILLGGGALYLALSGGKNAAMTQRLDESGNQVIKLEQRLAEMTAKVDKLEQTNAALEKQLRSVAGQTQQALNQVGQEIINSRKEIAANTLKLKEVVEGLNSGQPVAVSANSPAVSLLEPTTSTDGSFKDGGGSPAAAMHRHVISEGDTFSSVAKDYGVSLQEVMNANPEANPRLLRIGQEINVPHRKR